MYDELFFVHSHLVAIDCKSSLLSSAVGASERSVLALLERSAFGASLISRHRALSAQEIRRSSVSYLVRAKLARHTRAKLAREL